MPDPLGSAYGEIILDAGPAQRGVEQASAATRALEGVVIGVSAAITTAMINAGAAIGKALGGIAIDGVRMAADLEEQMSGVQAVMGLTADEVAKLEELILDLGIDPNLKVSTLEAAQAIEMLGRNGLTASEIMAGAARATVLLANATGANFSTAADIATDAMSVFKIEAENMGGAVDGITSVVNNSKFTIEDYALALAQGGGVAATMGVSFADFNTVIAAISPNFASGSDAGTSFKTMLQRLAAPTDKARQEMIELGLATWDGVNAFFDAEGNLKDMADVAGLLQGALGDLSKEQQAQALTTIFGADAIRAAAAMMDLGEEELRELQAVMAETSAADAAATRMDNFRGALEILDGVMETIKIRIGQAFLPILTTLARRMSEFLEKNGDRFVAFFENVADTLNAFLSGAPGDFPWEDIFPDWLAGVIYTISGAVEYLRDVLPSLAKYFAFVAEEGDPLNDFLVDLPENIRPVVLKLGELFALLLENGPLVEDVVLGIGSAFASFLVINRVVGAVTGLITIFSSLSGAVSAAGGIIAAIVGVLGGPLTVVIGLVALLIGGLVVAWQQNWGDIQGKTEEAVEFIRGIIQSFLERVQAFWDEHGDDLMSRVDRIWLQIQDIVAKVSETIKGIVADVTAAIGRFWEKHGESIMTTVTGIWEAVKGYLQGAWEQILIALDFFSALLAGDWESVGELLFELWRNGWETILNFLAGIWDAVKPLLVELADAFVQWFTSQDWEAHGRTIIDGIKSALSTFWNAVSGIVSGWWTAFVTWFNDQDWQSQGQTVIDRIRDALAGFWNTVSSTVSGWWTSFVGWFDGMDWYALGFTTVTNILTGLDTFWETVSSTIDGWWTSFVGWFDDQDWGALATTAITGIGTKLTTFWENVKATVDGWYTSFVKWADGVDWGAIAQAIVDGIVNFLDNSSAVLTALVNMASGAWDAVKLFFESKSPSRLSMRLGKDIVDGLVLGLEQWADNAARAGTLMAEGVSDAISDAIFSFADSFSNLGNIAADRFSQQVLAPLRSQIDGLDDELETRREILAGLISISPDELKDAGRLESLYQKAVADGNRALASQIENLIDLETERAGLDERFAAMRQDNLEEQQDVLNQLADLDRERLRIQEDFQQRVEEVHRQQAEAEVALVRLERDRTNELNSFNHELALARQRLAEMLGEGDTSMLEDALYLQQQYDAALEEGNSRVADQIFRIWEMQNDRTEAEEEYADRRERIQRDQAQFERDLARLEQQREEREARIAALQENLMLKRQDLETSLAQLDSQRAAAERDLEQRMHFARQELADALAVNPSDLRDSERLIEEYFRAIHSGNDFVANQIRNIWAMQNERNALEHEFAEEQERILRLQQAQADLAFLKQQMELLDLIAEHGLNASDILGGLVLGLDASLEDVINAMTAALEEIVARTEDELEIASPSKVFTRMGEQIMAGLGAGITNKLPVLKRQLESLFAEDRLLPSAPSLPESLFGAMAMQPQQVMHHYEYRYDLTAQYAHQSEKTLRHDVQMLHLLNKRT